ncbi:ABC transporter ATP-binding protein [Blastococcus saxobsidens]|uniref:Oligopeptide ABC transporter (ATP-binding protein) n=1 Tax=Blastococcus saxobsidens (strain DD2) TaxID=1146883 RepID=H6RM25_BLASD|nr:ABC transporter ATP-binding protein [Blastococcus saxobsidens]CCG01267.1 Oligopeptide ABC transporter (ATP-binding protein) [Blastococcus saxobsidens DD2]
MSEPVLAVEDLRVRLRTPRGLADVVNGLSYTVGPGETVAVVGESGSGKSVSVLALLGLLPARVATVTGTALLQGEDLLAMSPDRLRQVRGPGAGMVFQDPMTSLNPVLTIGRQLVEGIRAHGDVSKAAARSRAADLLREVGLPDPDRALDRYPHELSGGMRQRVVIAIALSNSPSLLIADEATTALDVTVQAQIIDLVEKLQADHGTGVIWITHDLGVVAGIADRVLVMYGGRCVEDGTVDDVLERPAHPYTRGLLGSLPDLAAPVGPDGEVPELTAVPGLPPPPTDLPPGCVFWPRCPVRSDPRCEHEQPPLAVVSRGPGTAGAIASGATSSGAHEGGAHLPHRAATWCAEGAPGTESHAAGGTSRAASPSGGDR